MNFFDRVLQLHGILRDRRLPVPREELQSRLECSRATLYRLIDKLRDELGAPVCYAKGRGYYYDGEAPQFDLPGLWFTAEELTALLTFEQLLQGAGPGMVGEALAPLRDKVRALLGNPAAGLPDWSRRLRMLSQAARPAGPAFATLATALARRQQVAIRYRARSQDDVETERVVSPQRLTRYRDNWYLDAWCHWREGLRSFSVDRVREAALQEAAALECSDEALDAELAAGYGIFAGAVVAEAELLFSARAARWVAAEQWHPQQRSAWQADGRYRLWLPYSQADELVRDLLRHAGDVEVLGPAPLRDAVADAHAAGLAAHKRQGLTD